MRRMDWAVLVVVAGSVSATDARGDGSPFVVQEIVVRGDAAPGFEEPMFFADFGTHPDIELLIGSGDVPARIDTDGDITFHAYATPDGGLGECPAFGECVPHGIFSLVDGVISNVVLAGDIEPTTGDPYLEFPGALGPRTPDIFDGDTTFISQVGQNVFSDFQIGIFTERNGAIEPVVLEEETVFPGLPSDGSVDSPLFHLTQGRHVYFFAQIDTVFLPSDFRPEGLWRFVDGEVEAIAAAGLPAPDMPEGFFYGDTDDLNLFGTIGEFGSNRSGRVAYSAFIRGPGLTTATDEAIWVETDNGFEVLVTEGDAAPEGPFPDGTIFSGGDTLEGAFVDEVTPSIRMNDSGAVVFFAQLDQPDVLPRVPTLWSNRNGGSTLELVFRGRHRGIAFSVPGDEAPGIPNGHFFFPAAVEMDEAGAIYVQAFVETNDDIFESSFGIWVNRTGAWEAIAFEEGPVPDLPGVTFLPDAGPTRGIGEFHVDSDGTVLYTGFFLEEGSTTTGAFRYNPDGSNELLFKIGDPIDVGGDGEDVRVVTGFRLGTGASASGDRVMELTFADGSQGIFTANVAESLSTPRIVQRFGNPGETQPFSGYIDPRAESSDGVNFDLGIDEVFIEFSEAVRDIGGETLTAGAFEVLQSDGGAPPSVSSIETTNNREVVVRLDRPIALTAWTTIVAQVEGEDGNVITSLGDLGPGVAEPDRVDLAFLPGDIDQSGVVSPLDLLRFRQIVGGQFDPLRGPDADYVDTNRDGTVSPFDLLRFRQLVNGVSPATQAWAGVSLSSEQP